MRLGCIVIELEQITNCRGTQPGFC